MRTTRSSLRLVLILSVILALAVPLGVFAYNNVQKASAASTCNGYSGFSFCHTFDLFFKWHTNTADAQGTCCIEVHYHLTGAIGYNRTVWYFQGVPSGIIWYNQKLLAPKLHSFIYRGCSTTCVADTTTQFEMKQYWNGGLNCSLTNPQFSVSIPWGISVGGWATCGNRSLATFPGPNQPDDVFTYTANNYVSSNSGAKVSISDYINENGTGPCYGANITSFFHENNRGDTLSLGTVGVTQTCLPNTSFP
jgi:hypothetical protein